MTVNDSTEIYAATSDLAPGELVEVGAELFDGLPQDCLLASLGFRPTHVGRGSCRVTMTVGAGHLNQRGIVQAGALVALADAAAGWASYAAVESGRFTTLDLSCNLLRAAKPGDELVAHASPVHLGRRTLVIQVVVSRQGDEAPANRPVARVTCTQLVLD
ncbi:MAG: PaaI family thioesterase [Acidothermales bacterium]|nr:PaaI family thioesterase [Acidothermales bacterium]